MAKILAVQARGPEFRSPRIHILKNQGSTVLSKIAYIFNLAFGKQGGRGRAKAKADLYEHKATWSKQKVPSQPETMSPVSNLNT